MEIDGKILWALESKKGFVNTTTIVNFSIKV